MSEFDELLSTLRTHDVQLWVENGQLRYRSPVGALVPALRQSLVENKERLVSFLESANSERVYRRLGRNKLVLEVVAGQPQTVAPFFSVGLLEGLASKVSRDQPFYCFPYVPARNRAESASVQSWASVYVDEMLSIQPEGPYFLGGFCYPGVISFEMARQLIESGREVSYLALIDSPVPTMFSTVLFHLHRAARFITRFSLKQKLNRLRTSTEKRLKFKKSVPPEIDNLTMLNHKGTPAGLQGKCYRPQSYHGKVTLFQGDRTNRIIHGYTRFGWSRLIKGNITFVEVPGRHLDLMKEPNLSVLAQKFNESLGNAHLDNNSNLRQENLPK